MREGVHADITLLASTNESMIFWSHCASASALTSKARTPRLSSNATARPTNSAPSTASCV
jgi:hypothetical protein